MVWVPDKWWSTFAHKRAWIPGETVWTQADFVFGIPQNGIITLTNVVHQDKWIFAYTLLSGRIPVRQFGADTLIAIPVDIERTDAFITIPD